MAMVMRTIMEEQCALCNQIYCRHAGRHVYTACVLLWMNVSGLQSKKRRSTLCAFIASVDKILSVQAIAFTPLTLLEGFVLFCFFGDESCSQISSHDPLRLAAVFLL